MSTSKARGTTGLQRKGSLLSLLIALFLALWLLPTDWWPLALRGVSAANGLTITKEVDGNPLIGGTTVYTITVRNDSFAAGPNNPDGKAYNLDITDTLPAGVTFVSASPASVGAPTITTTGSGSGTRQVLTFTNITDLAINQTFEMKITATLAPGGGFPGVTVPGTALANDAAAAVSNNPRVAASISAGTASANSEALPFKLAKVTEQSTGVGQDTGGCASDGTGSGRQFKYALTATNNTLGPSANMVITETLPYGVDYCNSSEGGFTPTYTRNPDGTATLVYNLGTMTAGQVITVRPLVAIPYRYPTTDDITPAAPITNPLAGQYIEDATNFINRASMGGAYLSVNYNTGEKTSTVLGKYATIAKSGSLAAVAYNDIVTYTLTPSTSTNYDIDTLYVIDTLPDGQDYNNGSANIGGTAFAPSVIPTAVHTPCAGNTSPAAGVYLCPNGTTEITWGTINNAGLTPTTAGTQFSITFTATVRTTYRGTGQPVLAGDSLENNVGVTYNATSIHGDGRRVIRAGGGAIDSADSASQTTPLPTIDKSITAVTRGDGNAPLVNEGRVIDPNNAVAAVGDIVTFQIVYTGASGEDQKNIVVSDFLPTNYRYVANSSTYSGSYITGGGTINGSTPAGTNPECSPDCVTGKLLIYRLTGTGGNNIVPRGQALTITLQAQQVSGAAGAANDNLAKFSGVNTPGEAYSGRDSVVVSTLAPSLTINKSNSATGPVQGNQTLTYTITVRNNGTSTAYRIADLIDTLPADIRYTSLGTVTPAGAVDAPTYVPGGGGYGGTLTFPNVDPIAPGGSVTITYNAEISPAPTVGTVETNTARIASYASQPPGVTDAATYPAVQGQSSVTIGGETLTKVGAVHTPQVNSGGPLTIGDRIDYTITFVLPNNATFNNGEIRDCLPRGFRYLSGSYSATTSTPLPGPGALPTNDADTTAPGTFAVVAGTNPCASNRDYVRISFGTQNNSGAAITITVQLSAVITGIDRTTPTPVSVFTNTTQSSQTNDAYIFTDTTQLRSTTSPALTIATPRLTLAKSRIRPAGTGTGGTNVDFLLTLNNTGAAPAHDIAALIDTLDPGLSYVQAYQSDGTCQTATPLAGVTVAGQTVTIPVPSPLNNGTAFYVCLRAQLVTGGVSPNMTYNNVVTLGATGATQYYSAPSTFTDRRSYTGVPQATASVATPNATVAKSEVSGRPSANGLAVPGEIISYRLQFTIPNGTTLFGPISVRDDFNFGAAGARLGSPTDTTNTGGTLTCTNGATAPYTFAVTGDFATYTIASGSNLTATGGDSVCVFQLDAQVRNIPANNAGQPVISNTHTLTFGRSAGITPNTATLMSGATNVALREPAVTITKNLVTAYNAATGQATFRITVTNANTATTATAYDLTVSDTLPSGLAYVSHTAPTGGATVTTTTPFVFTVASLAPGASASVDLVVRGDGTLGAGTTATNTASLAYYDLPATTNGNNNQGDPASRRSYTGSDSAGVTLPAPEFAKAPANQTITIGADVDFTLTVRIPAGAALYNVTVGDTLPAGLVLRGTGISLGSPPGGGCPAPTTSGGNTSPLGLGNLQNATGAACVYTINVAARSDGTVPAAGTGSASVTNTGTLTYATTAGGPTTSTQATAGVTIQAPVLTLVKSVSPTGAVNVGETLTYTLTYSNTGPAAATGVQIVDTFSANTSVINANGGTVTGNTITFAIGTVPANSGTLTRSFTVRVNTLGNIANSATLSSNERPSITSGVNNGTTNLRATKAVSPTGSVAPGGTLTYTITLTNPNPATDAATSVQLSDLVPANTTFVSATNGGTEAGGTVSWPTFSVPVDGTVTRSFTVQLATPLSNGTIIPNTATFRSAELPGGGTTNQTISTVRSAPVLALVKSRTPAGAVGPNGTIDYTLVLTNTGNENAENATISDVIPTGTTFSAASWSGTYAAGTRTITWDVGTIASGGGSATVTFSVTVDPAPLTGQVPAGLTIQNTGSYAYSNASGGNSGSGNSNTVTNGTLSHTLTKSNDPVEATTVPAGDTITYTLVYRNTGSGNFTAVTISDLVPANTTFVSADNGGTESGGTVTWNLGAVSAGQERTVSFDVRVVTPLANGTGITNSATASGAGAASGTVPNISSNTVRNVVVSAPDFTIQKSNAPTTPVAAGATITYTLIVGNQGNEDATAVIVRDRIPTGATYVANSATGGNAVAFANGELAFTIDSLPTGTTTTLTFQVTVDATLPTSGGVPIDIVNRGRVTASTETGVLTTPVESNEVRNPTVGLAIGKSVAPTGLAYYGQTLTYAITYTNLGSLRLTGVVITDDVPSGTQFVNATAGGSFDGNGGVTGRGQVTWTLGTLTAGQTGTVSLQVRVDDPTSPTNLTIVNAATIVANEISGPLVSPQTQNPTSPAPVNSLAGVVYVDTNNNGLQDPGEVGIGGVVITLTGTDANNVPVSRTTTTAVDGSYSFTELLPGTYTLTEQQPSGYPDGIDTAGSLNGIAENDVIRNIVLPSGGAGTGYNFGELPRPTPPSPTPFPSPSSSPSASPTPSPSPTPRPSATPQPTAAPSQATNQPVDLEVSKTGPATATIGERITYTIVATNNGPGRAFRATLRDTVPASIAEVTWTCTSTGSAACDTGGGSGNAISLPVTIDAGAGNSVTLTVTGTVRTAGQIANVATIDPPANTRDPVQANNRSGVATTVPAAPTPEPTPEPTPAPSADPCNVPALIAEGAAAEPCPSGPPSPSPSATPRPTPTPTPSPQRPPDIQKVADTASAVAGQTVRYTIVLTNPGPAPLTGVVVIDDVPAAFVVQGATASTGTVTVEGQVVRVTVDGIPAGSAVTIVITTIATGGDGGVVVNSACFTGMLNGVPVQTCAMSGVGAPSLPNTGGGGAAHPADLTPANRGWWLALALLATGGLFVARRWRRRAEATGR